MNRHLAQFPARGKLITLHAAPSFHQVQEPTRLIRPVSPAIEEPIREWIEHLIITIPKSRLLSIHISTWVKSLQSVEISQLKRILSIVYAEYGTNNKVIFVNIGSNNYHYDEVRNYFFEVRKPYQRVSRTAIQRAIFTYCIKHFN